MTDSMNSLWPQQIKPKVLSPWAILKGQAEALSQQTDGILQADIKRKEIEGNKVMLTFDIVVPALENYRHRILNVGYTKDLPYPAFIEAEVFNDFITFFRAFIEKGTLSGKPSNRADSAQEFIDIVGQVLNSTQVLSIAQSLLARATDALNEKEQNSLVTSTESS